MNAPDPHLSPARPWLPKYPQGVQWDTEVPVARIDDALDRVLRDHAGACAFDFLDKRTSYREFVQAAHQVARGLQDLGYGPGTHLGLFLPNVPYYPIVYYGALRAGCTIVNFNPLYSDKELLHQASDSRVDAMVTLDLADLYNKVERLRAQVPSLKRIIVCDMGSILPGTTRILFNVTRRKDMADIPDAPHITHYRKLTANRGNYDPVTVDLHSHPCVLQYTGGTTGVPKGAVLTHATLSANVFQARHFFQTVYRQQQEVVLAILPFFHIFGMNIILNLGINCAAETVMIPRIEMDRILKAIDKRKVTFVVGVPSLFQAMLDNKKRERYDMRSIRFCVSGGAPLPQRLKIDFEAATKCTIVEGYGLSETSPVTHCNPIPGENKIGSIGLPMPATDIRILSLEDEKTFLPQGEVGEICIKGPQVMLGYWQNPQATQEVMIDGYFRTGDVGYLDGDGYTFIVDRKKDLILVGGYNVYPRAIEEAAYQMPGVEEAVAGGVPDTARGEAVKLWIKPREGASLTAADVKAFLRDKVSQLEMPKHVEIRSEPLPKTLVGKLSRKTLIQQHVEAHPHAAGGADEGDDAEATG